MVADDVDGTLDGDGNADSGLDDGTEDDVDGLDDCPDGTDPVNGLGNGPEVTGVSTARLLAGGANCGKII